MLDVGQSLALQCLMSHDMMTALKMTAYQDKDFLVACLAASIEGKTSLGAKFDALFQFAARNVKAEEREPPWPPWPEEVIERLLSMAVEWDSRQVLEELLQFSRNSPSLLKFVPRANSDALAKACRKNNYALVRPLVDRGYRLQPDRLDRRRIKKRSVPLFVLKKAGDDGAETFETDKRIHNLRSVFAISKE